VEVRLRHKPYARFSLSFEGRNFLRVRFEPFYGEWHVAAVDPSAGCSLASRNEATRAEVAQLLASIAYE
jgi:hypothetical protein